MAKSSHPTPEVLRQLLTYDSETGLLFWKHRSVDWFSSQHYCDAWNSRRAGKIVGAAISNGYKRVVVLRNVLLQHRVAIAISDGEWPEGFVDHINGDQQDNRRANLRVVDHVGNAHNVGMGIANKSGVHGVHMANGRWTAQITIYGKTRHLGRFDTILEARAARRAAELVLGYHENNGQRPSARTKDRRK